MKKWTLLIGWMTLSSQAYGAIAFVNATEISKAALTNQPLDPVTVAAGHLLVLTIAPDASNRTVSSVTDDTGNTWTQVINASASVVNQNSDIWYTPNSVGGATTITVTLSGVSNTDIVLMEFSGADLTAPLLTGSGAHINATSSSAPIGPTLTPDAAGELLVSVCEPIDNPLTGVAAPFVIAGAPQAFDTATSAYYIDPPVSATHAAFNPTTSQRYASSGAIFKTPAAVASGGTLLLLGI